MRILPLQSGTIQIASVAGEIRSISVSGLAKAQLMWLFRNFYILDFPVLSKQQQQLIAHLWHTGPVADLAAMAAFDEAPVEPIGTIEGFLPQRFQPTVTVPTPKPIRAHFALSSGMRIPALLTTLGVLLLGVLIGLWPRHESTTQPHAAAVPVSRNTHSAHPLHPRPSAEPMLAQASAEPALARIPAAETDSPLANQPTGATEASDFSSPGAMAEDASMPSVKPMPPPVTASHKAAKRPEVMIRVSVDSEGRAQEFHVLSGDQTKVAAALSAARHWSFQPCSSSAECEHLLKFTDHGDASFLKIID